MTVEPAEKTSAAPAHNDGAERIVLGAMMTSPRAIEAVTDRLAPGDFYRPAHEAIYATIVAAWAADAPTEPVAIAKRLADACELARVGGAGYLHKLLESVPTVLNAGHYADIVAEAAYARNAAEDAARLGQAAATGTREAIATTYAAITERAAARRGRSCLADLMHPGGSFVLDIPDTIPAIWGQGDDVLWAEGEALIIAGPSGVGKTTITGQILRARLGLGSKVLGWPVQAGQRVLYLAMDRPAQISRALHRVFTADERAILDQRCVFWKGPPPHDIAKRPETLLEMARAADADTVIVDSLKDAALGLSEDEVGASYNRARQAVLADGRQMLELHHVVKRGNAGAAPNTLADVYGSAHLVNGAGSVVMLWGGAGDPIVEFKHLKQPMNDVGPFKILHEGVTGVSSIWDGADLLELARRCTSGVTAMDAACVMYSTEKPSPSEQEKARRRLRKLSDQGLLVHQSGARGRGNSERWFAAAPSSWASEEG